MLNLGTGRGTTVRELLQAVRNVLGAEIESVDAPPRPGDIAGAFTHSARARELLDWQTVLTVEDGIRDTVRWFAVRDERLGR